VHSAALVVPDAGSLPRDRTIELWHGPGFGQTCDGCGLAITATEWMCLMCADDWRAIRLHEETLPDSWFDLASRPPQRLQTRCVAWHGVRSHAVPVELVGECSIPVV
jgi:hypothetical protein